MFLIEAKAKDIGGFPVRRALPVAKKRMVGPFVFFDHMGPVELAIGNGMDVRPHPHIGLSTLTYLFEGEIIHRDTLGVEQAIRPGAVNWMTAGSGIAHSERSSNEARTRSQRIHGIQTWIALPKEHEEIAPSFFHHPEKTIPEISVDGYKVRVIAGSFADETSPVGAYSELTYLDLRLPKGALFEFHRPSHELATYVVSGLVETAEGNIGPNQLGAFENGASVQIRALSDSFLLILGGKPLDGPRHIWWNFVSSSKERIEKAKTDWTNQALGKIRGETEFVPLPPN